MPIIPDTPPVGARQQRAAQLRAEAEPAPPASAPRQGEAGGAATDEIPQESYPGTGPVGQGDYRVKQGDCISSIAKNTGHFWETIWDDPGNTALKEVRKNPNVLLPEDRVTIPELGSKKEPGATEMRHRFVRKGQPEIFRVRVLKGGRPRGNEPCTLEVEGGASQSTTDKEGKVECAIPANARWVKLTIGKNDDVDEYFFSLGEVDPITELSGIQGRLRNLGFPCGPANGQWGPQTEQAIREFQAGNDLPVTGKADEATRKKLEKNYGC